MANNLSLWLIFIVLGFAWFWINVDRTPVQMIEICDNAKDDDGDGLIDLNDSQCICQEVKPVSLIPNPSFEEMKCCPQDRSQLDCAETWIQASEATTDYLHTCGWFGWPHLQPPLPLPDGLAAIGFRNGRFGNTDVPGWKEYTGACLLSPLLAGTTYRFKFYIGFINSIVSPPTTVTFFGTTDCANLPFGIGDSNFGCPTNGPGWKRLGAANVIGFNEWVEVNLTITPDENITAIAIGPDCANISALSDIYYFFDNLILADQRAFDFEVSAVGHPCSDDFKLQIPAYDSLKYQWYKDGVALIGETKAQLKVTTGDGDYQVRILSPTQCKVTKAFRHNIPVSYQELHEVICLDETYNFNSRSLGRSGVYWDTLKTALNCDSIIKLNLRVADEEFDTVSAKIFEGEYYQVGNLRYRKPGGHNAVLQSVFGCDSLVHLDLEFYKVFFPSAFSPNGDGSNDVFTIFGGPDLVRIKSLQIFNRWGNLVFQRNEMMPNENLNGWDGTFKGNPAPTGVYVYTAQLLMDDGKERQFNGSFVLVR